MLVLHVMAATLFCKRILEDCEEDLSPPETILQAVLFSQLYQETNTVWTSSPPLPKYNVLAFVGKEYGELMSSISPRNRVGRIL